MSDKMNKVKFLSDIEVPSINVRNKLVYNDKEVATKADLEDIGSYEYITEDTASKSLIISANKIKSGNNTVTGSGSVAFGSGNTVSGETSIVLGTGSSVTGDAAFAIGVGVQALDHYAHAEGGQTQALKGYSHAEGRGSIANHTAAHAEGISTQANGRCSHTEGEETITSGQGAHAEGYKTHAVGDNSHAAGYYTTANAYNYVIGHFNKASTGAAAGNTQTGDAFIIGNGVSTNNLSNAFRVTYTGAVYAASGSGTSGAYNSGSADYAEYFEWADENPDHEDRRGYFVTMEGEKIKIAKPGDYILGIISGAPVVAGNNPEDWARRYLKDDFGTLLTEEFEYEEHIPFERFDEETKEIVTEFQTVIKTGVRYIENPNYDPEQPYIERSARPEWGAVGMIGVLSVRDDGTCFENGYCQVSDEGIATFATTGYRVIKRVNDNIVKVIFK